MKLIQHVLCFAFRHHTNVYTFIKSEYAVIITNKTIIKMWSDGFLALH